MQQVKLFSESVTNSCGRFVGASSSDIAEPDIDSSSTTGAKTKSELEKKTRKRSVIESYILSCVLVDVPKYLFL